MTIPLDRNRDRIADSWQVAESASRLLNHYLPIRTTDNAPKEIPQIHQVRDTGVMAATVRHQGDVDWKHAVLTPMHLHIHHPAENLTINDLTNHAGWARNAGDSMENDFSFSPNSCLNTKNVAVVDGVVTIPMYCKDYAAWAEIRITLTKNNTPIHPEPITVTLPHDTTGDRIADQWQHAEVLRWNAQFRLSPGDQHWIAPSDPTTWSAIFGSNGQADAELADSDGPDGPMPAMADDGDGLTAFEEYRGFFLDGGPGITTPRHRRLSVARKELLVESSEMEGIASTTLRLPSDANANFTDQGNDPNAFAQAYSLTTTMSRISSFFAQEGAPVGNNPKYFPGAAIDIWWVKDKLNDMGYVVYENGAMGATHKYSGPYKDLQRPNDSTRDRIGWLSIASDENLRDSNPVAFSELYGGNSQGKGGGQEVAVLGNYGNRNNRCAQFIKLAVQGRKGFKAANGNFYAKSGEAAREQDERHENRATHQGAAVFVNSLSEEPDLVDQTAFEGRLEWSIAHELAHLFVVNDDDHFDGSGIVLSKTREVGLSKFVEDEIVNTKLRQRASINRDANGNPQP